MTTITITNRIASAVTVTYPDGVRHLAPGQRMGTDYTGDFAVTRGGGRCSHYLYNGRFAVTGHGLQADERNGRVFDVWHAIHG